MKLNLSKHGVETLIISLEEEAITYQELASLWETRAKFLEADLLEARSEISALQYAINSYEGQFSDE